MPCFGGALSWRMPGPWMVVDALTGMCEMRGWANEPWRPYHVNCSAVVWEWSGIYDLWASAAAPSSRRYSNVLMVSLDRWDTHDTVLFHVVTAAVEYAVGRPPSQQAHYGLLPVVCPFHLSICRVPAPDFRPKVLEAQSFRDVKVKQRAS